MREPLRITGVRLTRAGACDQARGLLGYVRFTLNDTVQVDGVTLRRTALGRLTLTYPARRDAAGWDHALVRPVDDAARREIEAAVFALLGLDLEAVE